MDLQLKTEESQKTPREVLSQFYKENNLDADGGDASASVKIELFKGICFYFPNFDQRRKAVIKHDIHHLLTGYSTVLKGETEISAWEIASGCKKYHAAFFINTSGLMMGFPLNFFGILRAFARGRKTKNLYADKITTEQAMDMPIAVLRREFLLDQYPQHTKPGFTDLILLLMFGFYGAIYSLLSLLLLPFIIIYSIYIALKNK